MFADDNDRMPRSALWLGLAGVIPFWAAALAFLLTGAGPGFFLHAGLAYGAVILSFLGGIRWGEALKGRGERERALLFALSVLPSLAGWAGLILPAIPGVSLLIAGFLLQALWDVISVQRGELPGWFARLRMWLTTLAVTALLLILLGLLLS